MTADFRSVPQQISEIAENYPDSIALSDGARQLNYRELNRRADRFAGYLVRLGIERGGTVALSMERSFDWVIAALGILRAGAAYVPLDPTWPDARLSYAVKDSGATVVVAREALVDRLRLKTQGLAQCVDPARDAAAIATAPVSVGGTIEPESLAYIIYTSGSTGAPKGVEITHANLNHLVRWHRDTFRVTRQDRASHLLSLGFDAAVMEIWPHLSAGATLCLADEEVRSSPDLIQEWMIREQVTIGLVPTVLGERLITKAWPAKTALRLLVIGGDVLHHGPARQLPFDVVNNYGPTECTVAATWSVLKAGVAGTPSIGRPISGTNVYLLNERGEPVPDGKVGEIYIGGDGVGRGYRNLPDLTERSFLHDPFSGAAAARMYRTGDRGARRPDGEIEFRGRLDRQTKIRGFRVELDEIAGTLNSYSSIDFATVVTRTSDAGENQLVAYVLPKVKAPAPTAKELQEHLLRSLPDYMVPAVFVRLNALPLSSNGKIDVANLSRFTDGQMLERVAAKVPASSVEERLLAIVRQLLQNDEVAMEDNFFLAGGHSLLGTQLLVRLRSEFGITLSLRQLFEAPTPARLALVVEMLLGQDWLAGVWAELLGRNHIQLDDNFFDLGGKSELLASVQRSIAAEFGRQIPIGQLIANPTVRLQAELIKSQYETHPVLPPGVLALQPKGPRNGIFWTHYLNVSLAKLIGDDQPFFVVRLVAEDFVSLGESPTLESVAACHVHKILSTQPRGPYTVGGFSLAGVLAFEIAQQLRTAGHEVSLLIMLDPPSPSYMDSPRRLTPKLTQPRYLLKRVVRLGLKTSIVKIRKRVFECFAPSLEAVSPRTEVKIAQETIEAAALMYQPRQYDGKVLLLLASERPPHLDFLPGWRAVVPSSLHIQYLDGHHEELTRGLNGQRVADAIFTHLVSAPEPDSLMASGRAQTYVME